MNSEIHPKYEERKFTCTCGASYTVSSTIANDSTLDICSNCHPFYTGKQKLVDTAGRVDRFRQKFGMKGEESEGDKK